MILYLAGPHTYPGLIAEIIEGGTGEIFVKQGAKAAMRLFMAGGISGNLKPFWKDTCRRMAEGQTLTNATEDAMKIFLAGWHINGKYQQLKDYQSIDSYRPYILESFFYADEDTERLIPHFGDFLLDSGAFTFMQGRGGSPDFDDYVERYADFINRNKIDKFFELDIDSVVGYDRVKQIRAKLERLTGKQSIPVWHKSRGKDEYIGACKDYPYVAIGGLVDGAKKGEYARQLWKFFPWFINTAHENGAKIHALGFTSLDGIRKYHFDSVDSTAWTTGNRFGYLYWFDGQTIQKKDAPKGYRIGNSRAAALNNYVEWIKFQQYADKHL